VARAGRRRAGAAGSGAARVGAQRLRPASPGHPTVEAFIAALNVDDGERAQIRSAIAATLRDLVKERKHNIATALAATVGLARSILEGQQLTDRAVERLRWSINDTLGHAPGFAAMGAERKQALYEALEVETALLALSWNATQQNPRLRPRRPSAGRPGGGPDHRLGPAVAVAPRSTST
jgi:hypothetical protein